MAAKSAALKAKWPEILQRIAEGEALATICREYKKTGFPSYHTVDGWLKGDEAGDLTREYARACEARGDYYGFLVAEIGWKVMRGEIGHQEARVAIDAFKWTAGRMAGSRWGDKVTHDHKGLTGNAIVFNLGASAAGEAIVESISERATDALSDGTDPAHAEKLGLLSALSDDPSRTGRGKEGDVTVVDAEVVEPPDDPS